MQRSVVLLCLALVCISSLAENVNQIMARVQSLTPDQIPALMANAEAGDVESQVMIGLAYRFGHGVNQSLPDAARWLRKASQSGSAAATNDLGVMYQNGVGVPQDDSEAAKLFQRAAELGDAAGQANLGFMYARGRGVPNDQPKAFEWTQKSAEQGYAVGEMNLGFLYLHGEGTAPDAQRAIESLTKAAQQGLVEAQGHLARAYLGIETPEGDEAAFKWLSIAAEHGDKKSNNLLDILHGSGQGGLKINSGQELTAVRLKAQNSDPGAQNSLGTLYTTSSNPVLAYFWFSLLAENRQADATRRKNAKGILKLMPKAMMISKPQIAQAETRLNEWHALHPRG
jgi:TPR repeat protein